MSLSKKSIHPLITKFLECLKDASEYQECELEALALILQIQNGHPNTSEYLKKLRRYSQPVKASLIFSDKDWNTLVESGYLNSICTILTDVLLD